MSYPISYEKYINNLFVCVILSVLIEEKNKRQQKKNETEEAVRKDKQKNVDGQSNGYKETKYRKQERRRRARRGRINEQQNGRNKQRRRTSGMW